MNPCPNCKQPPFGVIESAPTWIDGEPYCAVQCGNCKYVVGITRVPRFEHGWGGARLEAAWHEFTKEAKE